MMRRLLSCAAVAVAGLALATPTSGEVSFGGATVPFDNGSISGEIELVSVISGVPEGADMLEGETADTDDSYVLRVTMHAGAVRRVGVGAWSPVNSGIMSTGAGSFPDDPDADVSMFGVFSGPTWRVYQFDGGLPLRAGSDRFYVSFDRNAIVPGDLVNFSLTPGSGMGTTFGVSAEVFDADAATCDEDTNGDGMVNVLDVSSVVLDWGTDGSSNNGDVVEDGIVNVTDLVAVVSAFGACE